MMEEIFTLELTKDELRLVLRGIALLTMAYKAIATAEKDTCDTLADMIAAIGDIIDA